MGSEVIVVPSLFGAIFGIAYLYFSTRNKERLALIEQGTEASIFSKRRNTASPIWKVILLNLSLLFMGVGLGIFIASMLHYVGVNEEVAYPGTIFLMTGIALFSGFKMTKKLDNQVD